MRRHRLFSLGWTTALGAMVLALGCSGTNPDAFVDVAPTEDGGDAGAPDGGPGPDREPPSDGAPTADAPTPPPTDVPAPPIDVTDPMDVGPGPGVDVTPPPPMDGGPLPSMCRADADCGPRGYCAGMGCGTPGACAVRPDVCPGIYAPVCGCDGRTYSSDCIAAANGVRVSSVGECPTAGFCAMVRCAAGFVCCEAERACVPAGARCGGGIPDGGMADVPTVTRCAADGTCPSGLRCCPFTNLCNPPGVVCVEPVDSGVSACAAILCGPGTYCCESRRACIPTAERCDGTVVDAGVPDTGAGGCASDRDCLAGQACCAATGRCYAAGCLACCMPTADAGVPGCRSNADCTGRNEYCAGTGCGTAGTCQVRPDVCPLLYAPVCGCDGRTYSNDCAAASAGVRVSSRGECATLGTCRADSDCPAGQACCGLTNRCYDTRCLSCCMARPAACRSNADCRDTQFCAGTGCGTEGTCLDRPTACPRIYSPVCGCDGRTYNNECEAQVAGVRVSASGVCPPTATRCTTAADCGRGSECVYNEMACVRDGVCMPAIACLVPVTFCGCDGRTYTACRADRPTSARGACAPTPAMCRSNADCTGRGEWCAGSGCGTAGTCAARPTACPDVYSPVCGCDGRTYGNECEAQSAGVRTASRGECAPTTTRCTSAADCARGSECVYAEMACAASGTCQAAIACLVPVTFCGCDGRTYSACRADRPTSARGACGVVPSGCRSNADCRAGTYCAGDGCDTVGTCTARPDACTTLYAPVCGCDGRTYSNSCTAAASGVRVVSRGACP